MSDSDHLLEMLGGPKDGLVIRWGYAPLEMRFPVPAYLTAAEVSDSPPIASAPIGVMVYLKEAQLSNGRFLYRWDGYR